MSELIPLVQVISAGGSFTLLAAITVWLMWWIPTRLRETDKQAVNEMKSSEVIAESRKDETIKLADAFLTVSREERKSHEQMARYEREECGKRWEQVAAWLEKIDENSSRTSTQVEALDRHTRANIDQILSVREYVSRLVDTALGRQAK